MSSESKKFSFEDFLESPSKANRKISMDSLLSYDSLVGVSFDDQIIQELSVEDKIKMDLAHPSEYVINNFYSIFMGEFDCMIYNPKLVEFIYRYMPLLDVNNLNSFLSELEEIKANGSGNNTQTLEDLIKESTTILNLKKGITE